VSIAVCADDERLVAIAAAKSEAMSVKDKGVRVARSTRQREWVTER